MKRNYNVIGSNRREMVKVIGQAVGTAPVYKKVPTCAYAIGDITVSRRGELLWDERTDDATIQKVIKALKSAGFTAKEDNEESKGVTEVVEEAATEATEGEVAEEEEPETETEATEGEKAGVMVSLPVALHSGNSLRNLINLVYTRAGLINKALNTSFAAEQGLIDALAENKEPFSAEDFCNALADYEDEHGPALAGIQVTPEKITFSSLPETSDPDTIRAFTELVAMMSKQALAQKRIQAKDVNEENEKYALRIWLTRLGMNGAEYKATRKILMANLAGHSAFRTEADKERWTQHQAEKREAAKAEKEVHA